MKMKRLLSVLLVALLLLSSCTVAVFAQEVEYAQTSANIEISEVGKDYGLMDNIQDGNILHCFNWKHSDVQAMLPQIAEAGFTSVQVSPAQDTGGSGVWWWAYQPLGFWIGNNAMGNKSSLTNLCNEADKYGIKIIVDVVANHLVGDRSKIPNDLRDGQYWHSFGSVNNWSDRNQVINGEIGMPDLNTAHGTIQQKVKSYLAELKACGVDGIRWDAAKHIGLPCEGDNFWSAVTSGSGLYHYGEILVGPADGGTADHLMDDYTTYMSVTDSTYGKTLRDSFSSGNAVSGNGNWSSKGIANNKLVYWAESHDTWSNNQEWGFSNGMSQNAIDRAYAVAASRDGATGLYFSRPSSTNKDGILMGQKGSTHFTSPEVAAVNHFRNAMNGQKEYVTNGNNCTVICREQGAVIVAGSNSNFSVTVPNGGSLVKPGTYTDEITGSTWTVTSSEIRGQIGSSGIAVIYNPTVEPSVSVSQKGGNFKTDTLSLTLSLNNATSGTYSIDGGAAQTFTGTKTITIGQGVAVGSSVTVKVTATDGKTTTTETYTFTKADPNATGIYFDNSSKNWDTVYCYIYNDKGAVAEWPGTKMTNEGNNIWFMEPSSGFETCNVIFSNGNGDQTPGAQETGYPYNDSPMIYKNNNWEAYLCAVKPTVPTTTSPKPTQTAPTQTDPTEPSVPSTKVLLGDADQNVIVNVKDASAVQYHAASQKILSGVGKFAADADSSGVVNIKDAALVQKHLASMNISYPVGKYVDYNGEVVSPDPVEPTTPTQPTTSTQPTQSTKPSEPVDNGNYTVYFCNSSGWSQVNAYFWGDDGDGGGWPGKQMSHVDGTVYKIEIDKKFINIIFNTNGGSLKTDDLSIPGNNQIFNYANGSWSAYSGNPDDYGSSGNNNNNNGNTVTVKFIDSGYWGYVKAICWKNSNSQQRDEYEMRKVGDNMFEVQVPSGYDKIYFTNGHQWCQDQNFPSNGGTFDYYTGWK